MLTADYNYQYIDWDHDPIPGEDFDHLGNLVTNTISPAVTLGLSNFLNLTFKKTFGIRSMDWMGLENSAHHRDETSSTNFKNAHGNILGDTNILLKYLLTNAGSESGSRIFLGLGLTIPSNSVLTKSPYLSDENTGEALEEHRHFSLSDGCYKMNYEFQYYVKSNFNYFLLPSFYGFSLNYFDPIDESQYGYNPGPSLVNIASFLYRTNFNKRFLPKAVNIGVIFTRSEASRWNGKKSPIEGMNLFMQSLGFNWVDDKLGSFNINIRYMDSAPLQSDKLNNNSTSYGVSLGYRKVLDYTVPWLYW